MIVKKYSCFRVTCNLWPHWKLSTTTLNSTMCWDVLCFLWVCSMLLFEWKAFDCYPFGKCRYHDSTSRLHWFAVGCSGDLFVDWIVDGYASVGWRVNIVWICVDMYGFSYCCHFCCYGLNPRCLTRCSIPLNWLTCSYSQYWLVCHLSWLGIFGDSMFENRSLTHHPFQSSRSISCSVKADTRHEHDMSTTCLDWRVEHANMVKFCDP